MSRLSTTFTKQRLLVTTLAILSITLCLYLLWPLWPTRNNCRPPKTLNETVGGGPVQLEVEITNSFFRFASTPLCVIPDPDMHSILHWLIPAHQVSSDHITDDFYVGLARVRCADGQILVFEVYWNGKGPAVYRLNGSDVFMAETGYADDGALCFVYAIRDAFKRNSAKGREGSHNPPALPTRQPFGNENAPISNFEIRYLTASINCSASRAAR